MFDYNKLPYPLHMMLGMFHGAATESAHRRLADKFMQNDPRGIELAKYTAWIAQHGTTNASVQQIERNLEVLRERNPETYLGNLKGIERMYQRSSKASPDNPIGILLARKIDEAEQSAPKPANMQISAQSTAKLNAG